MERDTKILLAVCAALAVVVLAVLIGGRVQEELAPEPLAAMVAVSVADDPVARVGPVGIAAGEPFTLHAVLEARSWQGDTVYYTEAPALAIGDRQLPADRLRRWSGPQRAQVLWFTVEGSPPFLEVASAEELDRLQFREILRAEWPLAWSVPGSVLPSRRRQEAGGGEPLMEPFGTQRYHVRIELFGPQNTVVPARRFKSAGSAQLAGEVERFPTVTARLPAPLDGPSSVFGLPQVEPVAGLSPALAGELAELTRKRLAFSRAALLAELLAAAGRDWEAVEWRAVDLDAGPVWGGGGVAAGDLLRVGGRVVLLAEDQGVPGLLDDGDVAFDFDKGATVRRLADIFTGEGLVEWGALAERVGGG